MKLSELKKSTLYQSSDLDDMEVLIAISRNGKRQLEPLVFLGMMPVEDSGAILLGGLTEMQRMVESGAMTKPKGYFPPAEEVSKLIEGDSNSPTGS